MYIGGTRRDRDTTPRQDTPSLTSTLPRQDTPSPPITLPRQDTPSPPITLHQSIVFMFFFLHHEHLRSSFTSLQYLVLIDRDVNVFDGNLIL